MVKRASVSAIDVVRSKPRGAGTLGVIDLVWPILLLGCGLFVKMSCRVLANRFGDGDLESRVSGLISSLISIFGGVGPVSPARVFSTL
jgi:hypothetical protein